MSKPFNQSLHDDIALLHKIDRKSSPVEFRRVFNGIMRKHSISRSTVFKELKKEVPGSYRSTSEPKNTMPIGEGEITRIKDLVMSRHSSGEIKTIMKLELGFNYSEHRLNSVKNIITSRINSALNNMPQVKTQNSSSPLSLGDGLFGVGSASPSSNPAPVKAAAPTVPAPPGMREFFYHLCGLNLKEKNCIQELNFMGVDCLISSQVIKECLDRMAHSAGSGGMHLHEAARFDMETVLMKQLKDATRGFFISPSGLKQLESIRRSLDRSDSTRESGPLNTEAVIKTVKQFAPRTSRADILRSLDDSMKKTPPGEAIGETQDTSPENKGKTKRERTIKRESAPKRKDAA